MPDESFQEKLIRINQRFTHLEREFIFKTLAEESNCLGSNNCLNSEATGSLFSSGYTFTTGSFSFTEHGEKIMDFLSLPLDDMPLYINYDQLMLQKLAIWRLKIAK
jgi:hypothetical protein